jgi:hypothetical protein
MPEAAFSFHGSAVCTIDIDIVRRRTTNMEDNGDDDVDGGKDGEKRLNERRNEDAMGVDDSVMLNILYMYYYSSLILAVRVVSKRDFSAKPNIFYI